MKKAADALPNRVLKYERERRCWSQLEVADRIGTTALNVSRWERGITVPGAHFRQQLCAMFAKSPQELGFLDPDHAEDLLSEESPSEVPAGEKHCCNTRQALFSAQIVPSAALIAAGEESNVPIWHLPYQRNLFFTGREDTLALLHALFQQQTPSRGQPLAICALGGMGKTQLATEYVYRYRQDYRWVFWARADTCELLVADFANIAGLLSLSQKNVQDQHASVAAVKRWLSQQTRWLLVLDNVDDPALIGDFLPETISGHLLLTTRTQSTGQLAQRIRLEKLSLDESMLLLLRRAKFLLTSVALDDVSDTDRLKARDIATVMDGLPLALDQAAAYIEETGCGLDGYIERYRQHTLTLLCRRGGLRPDHPESLVTTWLLSFEKLARADPATVELLHLCAFFDPDAIAEKMLVAGARQLTFHLDRLVSDPFEMDEAIGTLTTFSLVYRDPDQGMLTLHRLVQVVLRAQMDAQKRVLWAERAIQVVEHAFSAACYSTRQHCRLCLPHALVCVEFIEQFHITLPAALSLLNKTGSYLRENAQHSEAERVLSLAVTLGEETLPADSPLLAEILNNRELLA